MLSSDFRRVALVLIAVAAGLHGAALFQATPLKSANDRSRWSTVWSLVERGTFAIDEIDVDPAWHTIDKVQQDGRLYSTKPALLTVMAAEIYRVIRHTLGWSIYAHPGPVTRLILAVINLVPWIVALAVIASIAAKYAQTGFARVYLLAAAAFGTFLSTYLVTFNNHTVAAVSLVFAIWFALRIVAEGSRCPWDFALCGLTSAFVTTNELPAALFGLAMFALLLRHDWRQTLCVFVPAALVPIVAFIVTTWLQTGSWKPFYMSYGTEKYIFIRDGVPSYWAEPKGLDRNLDSAPVYFLHCTLGHHGILSLSPVFLLTIVTWLRLWKRPAEPYRPLLWMGLAMTVAILGFYMTRTENYNYGGNSVALRWAIWLVPFWLLALLPTLDDFAEKRWFRIVAVLLLAGSTFSAWEAFGNPWRPSWLYTQMEEAGWIDYRDVDPPLPKPLTTWFATLPPAGANPEQEWIELTATTERGHRTLRLELVDSDEKTATLRATEIETISGIDSEPVTATATIDRAKFDTGADPETFLISADPSTQAALGLFRRLPASTPYRAGRVRYTKTKLRELAFQTQHAAAASDVHRHTGELIRTRIDTWLSEDAPFGVVKFRESHFNVQTGEILSQQDFVLTGAGRLEEPEWTRRVREVGNSE